MVYDDLVLSGLAQLAAAPSEQAISWAGLRDGEMASFIEAIETLFDDSGLGDALDRGRVYSRESDDALRSLRRMAILMDDQQPIGQLVEDPNLASIRALAADLLPRIESGASRDSTAATGE